MAQVSVGRDRSGDIKAKVVDFALTLLQLWQAALLGNDTPAMHGPSQHGAAASIAAKLASFIDCRAGWLELGREKPRWFTVNHEP